MQITPYFDLSHFIFSVGLVYKVFLNQANLIDLSKQLFKADVIVNTTINDNNKFDKNDNFSIKCVNNIDNRLRSNSSPENKYFETSSQLKTDDSFACSFCIPENNVTKDFYNDKKSSNRQNDIATFDILKDSKLTNYQMHMDQTNNESSKMLSDVKLRLKLKSIESLTENSSDDFTFGENFLKDGYDDDDSDDSDGDSPKESFLIDNEKFDIVGELLHFPLISKKQNFSLRGNYDFLSNKTSTCKNMSSTSFDDLSFQNINFNIKTRKHSSPNLFSSQETLFESKTQSCVGKTSAKNMLTREGNKKDNNFFEILQSVRLKRHSVAIEKLCSKSLTKLMEDITFRQKFLLRKSFDYQCDYHYIVNKPGVLLVPITNVDTYRKDVSNIHLNSKAALVRIFV
ncbi:hypothetical protein HELRODRAFT_172727 [Helobdella robusta]|uniref:Uncharacterized protein n=1 Tax=Helobdella robusta TaxID=6412 RepID=T1F5V2_HELRO|nr:hypothetical protein HELRODRAFT_172727 [Helobdella robusta]ESO04362.1 hypothetical protein HELRODRAFT_172727 [Helobdella robusta]